LLPEGPGRQRIALLPQTGAADPGGGLGSRIVTAFGRFEIAVVAGEVPGEPVCYQLQADIGAIDEDESDQAAVDIGLDDRQAHAPSIDGLLQRAPRCPGPGLTAFGSVDAGQAYSDDPAVTGAHAKRIAVIGVHDGTCEPGARRTRLARRDRR